MRAVPLTLAQANALVAAHHRHSVPPQGHKWSVGVADGDQLTGVAVVGRPTARLLDDGVTLEVLRVCTNGHRNACSFLYATCWRAARALGYQRLVTYTRGYEAGSSLRAAGFRPVAERAGERATGQRKDKRDVLYREGVPRVRWERGSDSGASVTPSVTAGERRCAGCGRHLPRNLRATARHCGNSCRQRAFRRRAQAADTPFV